MYWRCCTDWCTDWPIPTDVLTVPYWLMYSHCCEYYVLWFIYLENYINQLIQNVNNKGCDIIKYVIHPVVSGCYHIHPKGSTMKGIFVFCVGYHLLKLKFKDWGRKEGKPDHFTKLTSDWHPSFRLGSQCLLRVPLTRTSMDQGLVHNSHRQV